MGCTEEMADGVSKKESALGLWRLVCNGLVVWTGQEGLEHVASSWLYFLI